MKTQNIIKNILFLLSLTIPFSAHAATLNVDTNDPACSDVTGTPYCTIQAAVTAAIENDTIEIASGIYNENVTSTDKGLILQGEDVDTTIVDGSGLASVIKFTSATNRDVVLEDLTIRNGSAADGGGVYHQFGTLSITRCHVINNDATGSYGAGVFFNGGTLTISESELSNNSGPTADGGGVAIKLGDFTLSDSTIYNNDAHHGGGIYHGGSGQLVISNSTIEDNTANTTGLGGGIYHQDGAMILSESSVSYNEAHDAAGIYKWQGALTITDSTIEYNEAPNGNVGGVYLGTGTLFVSNISVSYNEAKGYVGIAHQTGTVTIADSEISFNEGSSDKAGGVYQENGSMTITNTTVQGNEATESAGVYHKNGTLTITNSFIIDNETTVGNVAGIFKEADGTVITHSTIDGNHTVGYGGGVLQTTGNLEIVNTTISNNTADLHVAGLGAGGTLNMFNSTISGNEAGDHVGGLYGNGATMNLNNVTIVNNISDADNDGTGEAGGIYNSAGTMTVRNSLIALNTDRGGEFPDCFGTITSDGYNILGDDTGCTFTSTTGDQVGTGGSVIDPLIDSLADNGGSTQTHALQLGSPALDAGNPAGCVDTLAVLLTTDQRGFERHVDGDDDGVAVCDIGAYEVGSCGDGYLDEGEACDDGNGVDTDACTNLCLAAVCGDGSIQDTVEECDDGNTTDGDDCSAVCEVEVEVEVEVEEAPVDEEPVVVDDPIITPDDDGTDADVQADTNSETGSGDQAGQGGGCSLTLSQTNPLNVPVLILLFMPPVVIFPIIGRKIQNLK